MKKKTKRIRKTRKTRKKSIKNKVINDTLFTVYNYSPCLKIQSKKCNINIKHINAIINSLKLHLGYGEEPTIKSKCIFWTNYLKGGQDVALKLAKKVNGSTLEQSNNFTKSLNSNFDFNKLTKLIQNIYKISDKKARVISGYIWDIMAFKFAKKCNKNNETLFICHKNDLTTKLHLNVPNTKTWLSVEAPELTSKTKQW